VRTYDRRSGVGRTILSPFVAGTYRFAIGLTSSPWNQGERVQYFDLLTRFGLGQTAQAASWSVFGPRRSGLTLLFGDHEERRSRPSNFGAPEEVSKWVWQHSS
jgi:hypothetical protein